MLQLGSAACLLAFQGGLDKLAGAAATVDTLSKEAQQQRVQLKASQVPLSDSRVSATCKIGNCLFVFYASSRNSWTPFNKELQVTLPSWSQVLRNIATCGIAGYCLSSYFDRCMVEAPSCHGGNDKMLRNSAVFHMVQSYSIQSL